MSEAKVEAEAKALFDQLALLAAGHRTEVAWRAAQDLLTAVVASSCETPEYAARMAELVALDLKNSIIKNWDWYRSQVLAGQGRKQGEA